MACWSTLLICRRFAEVSLVAWAVTFVALPALSRPVVLMPTCARRGNQDIPEDHTPEVSQLPDRHLLLESSEPIVQPPSCPLHSSVLVVHLDRTVHALAPLRVFCGGSPTLLNESLRLLVREAKRLRNVSVEICALLALIPVHEGFIVLQAHVLRRQAPVAVDISRHVTPATGRRRECRPQERHHQCTQVPRAQE